VTETGAGAGRGSGINLEGPRGTLDLLGFQHWGTTMASGSWACAPGVPQTYPE